MTPRLLVEFPDFPPGESLTVSATLYTTFLQCPDEARGRLAGIYPEDTEASFKGVLAHRVFARHLTEGPLASERFEQVCREEIGKALNPKLSSLGLKPSRLRVLMEEVGGLYERFTRFPTEGFRGAESTLVHDVGGGVSLRGVIDAVFEDADGRTGLVDWKTGNLGHAQRQLDFYALLWVLEQDELPGYVEAASVATGERYTHRPTQEELRGTVDRVTELVSDMRDASASASSLERVAGPWCRHCALLDDCGEGRAAVKLGR